MWPSITLIISTVFIVYISHSVWTIYNLYNPKPCPSSESCLQPAWSAGAKYQFVLCTSVKSRPETIQDLKLLWSGEDFDISQPLDITLNVSVPPSTRRNGSLFLHAFLNPQQGSSHQLSLSQVVEDPQSSYEGAPLTKYNLPLASTFNLLTDSNGPTPRSEGKLSEETPLAHWKPRLSLHVMAEPHPLFRKNIPYEISSFLKLNKKKQYLPMIYISDLSFRIKELLPLNESQKVMPLTVAYVPISVGRLRLMVTVQHAMKNMQSLGFTEKDTDEVKSIFFDTNIYLLLLTCMVSAFHLLFDFLAFKNEISFWRKRKDMVGLSFSTLVWRCLSQTIVSFYLLDENTSLLVLCPSFLAAAIEVWKVSKAAKVTVTFHGWKPAIQCGVSSQEEKETEKFDSESMRYLSYILYPLVICGAIYSLLYTPHKSWYSWMIQSLANGVYAFGFLFMLPQLFVNYRLKSVAHLPWRAFMYKAFNTFIDDLFAFIITMPTAHRVACFRDDFVFLIYLYQRWLYPVDKARVNEYGQAYESSSKKED